MFKYKSVGRKDFFGLPLAHNRQEDDPRDRQGIIAPLEGVLRCGHCNCAMMPTYSNKGTKRYYYYQCYQETRQAVAECPVHQIPSGDVEKLRKEMPIRWADQKKLF